MPEYMYSYYSDISFCKDLTASSMNYYDNFRYFYAFICYIYYYY